MSQKQSTAKSSNVATPGDSDWYAIGSDGVSYFEGQLLTLVDAIVSDREQRAAFKSIISRTLWRFMVDETCRVDYADVKFHNWEQEGPRYKKAVQ